MSRGMSRIELLEEFGSVQARCDRLQQELEDSRSEIARLKLGSIKISEGYKEIVDLRESAAFKLGVDLMRSAAKDKAYAIANDFLNRAGSDPWHSDPWQACRDIGDGIGEIEIRRSA